jgi:hypothetical protein
MRFGDPGHWCLHVFCLWISLCYAKGEPVDDLLDKWGISLYWGERYLALNWREHYKHFMMPWSMDHCRTSVMLNDGSFVPYERFKCRPGTIETIPEPEGMYRRELPYTYVMRSVYTRQTNEIQRRTAAVTVERREWCWRAWPFRALRWPSKVRTSINVKFSDEVGERTGSWKGGTIGCGYELRSNETPEECLQRMELERKFD